MIISVPNSLNFSQRSLFSSRHSTLSSSGQLHLGLRNSAHGFGADAVRLPSLVDEVDGDGDGDRHDGDSDWGLSVVVSEWAVEQRLPSIDGSELGGLWWPTSSGSEPGERGGECESSRYLERNCFLVGESVGERDLERDRFCLALVWVVYVPIANK